MFVAVTKITFDEAHRDKVVALARDSAPIFRKQPGLVSMTMHIARDGSHTMGYLVWESEADHLNCMQSPDFEGINPRFNTLFESGEGVFELATYETLDV